MPTSKSRVDTATLIRGEVYVLRHPDSTPQKPLDSLRFKRDVPVVIEDRKMLAAIAELYDELEDGEGEVYEKPMFRIDRNVTRPDDPDETHRHRLSADRVVKKRPRRNR